jgi:hypothetical protein
MFTLSDGVRDGPHDSFCIRNAGITFLPFLYSKYHVIEKKCILSLNVIHYYTILFKTHERILYIEILQRTLISD